jgi:uncharacterized protein (DUF4415 family)
MPKKIKMDAEMEAFSKDVLESIRQAKNREYADVHTPEKIMARRGRPLGSVAEKTKEPVKLRLDADVVAALRATGRGWQTRVNAELRDAIEHGRLR